MSSELALSLSQVTKTYYLYDRPEDRLKQMVIPRVQRLLRQTPNQFYTKISAVDRVSLEVPKGQTLGIVGRNGSGKSTLLQMMCGTLAPTSGEINVNGRVAALLELGAGFNGEFSGRDNVFLNASILGLPKEEIEDRFDAIERFANIGSFIDHPVKTYSSGMYVRLAFSVAINVDPDILVVDEALAVGDEAFQRKCFARLDEIKEAGATILFVSHSADAVLQLCDRAVLMDGGEKLMDGSPKSVVHNYQKMLSLPPEQSHELREKLRQPATANDNLSSPSHRADRVKGSVGAKTPPFSADQSWFDPNLVPETTVNYGENGARITDARFIDSDGAKVNVLQMGERYTFEYEVEFTTSVRDVIFGMQIKTLKGIVLTGVNNTALRQNRPCHVEAGDRLRVAVSIDCNLLPGVYLTDVGVLSLLYEDGRFLHRIQDGVMFKVAPNPALISIGLVDFDPNISVRTETGQSLIDYKRPTVSSS